MRPESELGRLGERLRGKDVASIHSDVHYCRFVCTFSYFYQRSPGFSLFSREDGYRQRQLGHADPLKCVNYDKSDM